MKKLKQNDKIIVYHKIDEAGNHYYYFYDCKEKIELDWGETGHIPNGNDRFSHPVREIPLILDDILWIEDDPSDPE